ncbi:MAG TPA: pyridoxamine 5'-phosphate oxidase family protein [Candidatus Paceibacterota bacterium]|jgi:general stress protein 26|nr:pyridoxamine 5'-phosphate oxidase family protein [Candidatus Paceibacterota bacterium]
MDDKTSQKEKAIEFVRTQRTAVVSTVSPEGEPQSATITFVVDNDFAISFATRKSSRKYQNIMHNARAAVTVGFDSDRPVTVQIQGTAEVLMEGQVETIMEMLPWLVEQGGETWPLLHARGMDFAIIKIKPTWIRWFTLDLGREEGHKENFYQILP